jgi:hypothetical protein
MPLKPGLLIALASAAIIGAPSPGKCQPSVRTHQEALDFFEQKIRPLLVENCYTCHSANTNSHGGLRVDDRNGLLQGGKSGPAVVPGRPEESLLIRRVSNANPKTRMPQEGQLSPEMIADLKKWIRDGAAWPPVQVPASLRRPEPEYERLKAEHWAWQPLHAPRAPAVRDPSWCSANIDRFILSKIEAAELRPVNDLDKTALVRRLTFDLTGLPPTPAQIDVFLQDDSPDAYERVVDCLLASPAFGERWGRHWLDVARYGESTGGSRNVPYPHAWRYRDYVIDAFNADEPYDRFLREQISGDLLPAKSPADRDRQIIATGFLALGVKDVNQRFKVRFVMDNIDEQIDTVGRSILGLTLGCARCHNHKFDPIPNTEYYALAGIFHSTDNCAGVRNKMGGGGFDYYDTTMLLDRCTAPRADAGDSAKIAAVKKEYDQAKAEWEAIRDKPAGQTPGADGIPRQRAARKRMEQLQEDLFALTDPGATGRALLGVRDSKVIGDSELRVRGEAEKLGPVVPRGFLSVLQVAATPRIDPRGSGRLELAQWLTSANNPLPPRVMVNRVWRHLFGQGLVASVDNFGTTGAEPSHPELLDYLAVQFIRDGWSIKKLVREIVLTRTYRLSANSSQVNSAVDPGNRLIWRHSPRRLDAEEIRDAMLLSAGTLNPARPQGSPAMNLKVIELSNNGPEARRLEEQAVASPYRSVYLPLLRGLAPRSLATFDFAEQGMVTGRRETTTVAPQALYLLNDAFVVRQSLALAERLLRLDETSDASRIGYAYRLALGRKPSPREVERTIAFLADFKESSGFAEARTAAWTSFCQALLCSAEFRYLR